MKSRLIGLSVATLLAATPTLANEYEPAMRAFVEENVLAWAAHPLLVSQINTQNAAHAGLSSAEINEMDQAWRAQVGASDAPMISGLLSNDASQFLSEQVDATGGVISEVFITDNLGLNVASSAVTSDYWQGDEAKFTEVYGKGADVMHFGEIEFDESAQAYLGQVSLPVVDPDTNEVIGVMTIGLDAEAL